MTLLSLRTILVILGAGVLLGSGARLLQSRFGIGANSPDNILFYSDRDLTNRAYAARLEAGEARRKEAESLFRALVKRDPASPYRWCDLGEILAGDPARVDEARACFRRAAQLGPRLPAVLIRIANFHFEREETREALGYTARVLTATPDFDAVIFRYYTRLKIDGGEVLSYGLPDVRSVKSYFEHLISVDDAAGAPNAWDYMNRNSQVDEGAARQYATFLARHRRYREAAEVWSRHVGAAEQDRVFNGGFESEPGAGVFDWSIVHRDGVEVKRDSSRAYAGKWSLSVRFPGTANPEYSNISQTVWVQPGAHRFEAMVNAEGLTSDQGVGFRLYDAESPGRLDVQTERVTGSTSGWRRVGVDFVVPAGCNLMIIQVVRSRSAREDGEIEGAMWLDGLSIGPRP